MRGPERLPASIRPDRRPDVPAAPSDLAAQGYRAAADAPETLRAYRAALACFRAWCAGEGRPAAIPAPPEAVGAYLAALAPRYRLATLRRRLAALARAHRTAGARLDTRHPAIRETLRGIAHRHGAPQRRAAALATAEVRKLVAVCRGDLAGLRDRALLLLGYATALRRSELAAVEAEHLRFTADGLELLVPRAKGSGLPHRAMIPDRRRAPAPSPASSPPGRAGPRWAGPGAAPAFGASAGAPPGPPRGLNGVLASCGRRGGRRRGLRSPGPGPTRCAAPGPRAMLATEGFPT